MTAIGDNALRYRISAPLNQVLPLVPLLLSDEYRFDPIPGREAWRLRRLLDNQTVGWLTFARLSETECEVTARLVPGGSPHGSLGELTPALSRLVTRLRDNGLTVEATDGDTPGDESGEMLLLITPYRRLAAYLEPIASKRGLTLRLLLPNAEADVAGWQQVVTPAALVIADLSTPGGQTAARAAAATERPLVTIASVGSSVPREWQHQTVFYGQNPGEFFQALADRIAMVAQGAGLADQEPPADAPGDQTVAEPAVPPPAEQPPPPPSPLPPQPFDPFDRLRASFAQGKLGEGKEGVPLALPGLGSAPPSEVRLAIYRSIALDHGATLEQRFHAAQVLATYGDHEVASVALGAVACADTPLRDEALELLGTFGPAARVALWALDATEQNPLRNIAIARQLHAVGESSAARLRLERLARHSDREVRLTALHALFDLGVVAYGEFMRLMQQAPDPRVRLEAARWLRLHQLALPEVVEALAVLADHPSSPALARDALQELTAIRTQQAGAALADLARHAALGSIRLTAAQALARRGDPEAARAVFLSLAEEQDEAAAIAAIEALFALSQDLAGDAARLMRRAALVTIRCRAAAYLADTNQPEQVQQQAAQILLALGQDEQALPVLERLALTAGDESRRQWAAEQLIELGTRALGILLEVLEAMSVPALSLKLAETVLALAPEPALQRRVASWLAAHGHKGRATTVLTALALNDAVSEREAHGALTDLSRLAGTEAGALEGLSRLASEAPITSVRRRAHEYLRRHNGEQAEVPRAAGATDPGGELFTGGPNSDKADGGPVPRLPPPSWRRSGLLPRRQEDDQA